MIIYYNVTDKEIYFCDMYYFKVLAGIIADNTISGHIRFPETLHNF